MAATPEHVGPNPCSVATSTSALCFTTDHTSAAHPTPSHLLHASVSSIAPPSSSSSSNTSTSSLHNFLSVSGQDLQIETCFLVGGQEHYGVNTSTPSNLSVCSSSNEYSHLFEPSMLDTSPELPGMSDSGGSGGGSVTPNLTDQANTTNSTVGPGKMVAEYYAHATQLQVRFSPFFNVFFSLTQLLLVYDNHH